MASTWFGPAETSTSSLLLTCEHASQEVPAPWSGWPEADTWLVGMHWAIDLGAEKLARELSAAMACDGTAACFSRLLCDCNRPLDSEVTINMRGDQ